MIETVAPRFDAEEANDGTPMDEMELTALLRSHEAQAIGYQPGGNDEISAQQEKALNYYYGIMDDVPAVDGSSSVVDTTVSTVVDAALAAVLKPFVSSDETVSFAPRHEEDVEFAEQATEYVNYIFNCDNHGFQIMHDWFKDALLTKVGTIKVWWEDTSHIRDQRDLPIPEDPLHAAFMRSQPDYLGEANGVATFGTPFADGRVRVMNIPPEEFRITPFSRSIETAMYVAHVPSNVTRSDLIEMGFDPEIVETLPAYSVDLNRTTLRMARYHDEKAFDNRVQSFHPSQDRIALRDEYVRVDYDGDGVAELRRVMRCDDVILLNEPVDECPFATLCPVPMPHKVFGQSLADLAIEPQKISTVLLRQTLDNLYKSNNPRPVIGDGAWLQDGSTQESLEDNAPGAAIQVKDVSQFRFDAVPFTADKSYGMLQYIEQQAEQRTGVSQNGQGIDSNSLRQSGQITATQMAMMQGARNARVEMIARIFAETGVKRLFKLVLKLVTTHQQNARIIRLRNKFVPMDPRGWPEFDVSVSVGLGVGERSEQIMQADSIIQTMQLLMVSPFANLVTPDNAFNAVKRKFNAAGIKDVHQFLTEPDPNNPPAPPPNPQEQAAQLQAQLDMAKAQHDAQMSETKQQLAAQQQAHGQMLAEQQAAFQSRLAEQKMLVEAELAQRKLQAEAELAHHKANLAHGAKLAQIDMNSGDQAELSSNRPGGDLSK